MPDRLPIVRSWVQQGCRPIPCRAGTKHARDSWTRFQRHDPTIYDRHRWWTGTRQNNENVALILGPQPGGDLLALNINTKNGHDGPGTLQRLGWTLPPTPTIRTPSGGLCLFFKVPAHGRFPFTTYADTGYDGIEFRGAKGYQLVPTSRTPEGRYEFVPPWTLDRFRADLADLPDFIIETWVVLDSPKIFARDEPATIGTTRKHASTAAQPTPPLSPQPKHQQRSQLRPPQTAQNPTPLLTTITTVLSAENDRLFVDGFDVCERECAEAVCRRVDLPITSLEDGWPFACRLPGHGPDRDPSATWFRTDTGYYLYKDWHPRGPHGLYTVPDVFAALTSRVVKQLPDPSRHRCHPRHPLPLR